MPALKSLLTRDMIAAGNSEMSEWYMAVIEDIEEDIARSRGELTPLPHCDAQEFLNDFATEMYIKSRRGINLTEEN
jgi:hypothetical protein